MAAVPSAVPPAPRSLASLRRAIDSIDDSIHDLLMQRAEIMDDVAKAKLRDGGAEAPLFRPAREAEILRRLVARNRAPLPAALIVRLWREIIVELTRLQGPLKVAVPAGRSDATIAALARDHFGAHVLRPVASIAALINAVAKRRVQLGVLPAPGGRGAAGAWWQRLPADVRILARLPFLRAATGRASADAVVIGRQPFEASGDDALYVRIAGAKGKRAPLALGRSIASARRAGRTVTLVETELSLEEARVRLGDAGTIECLGGYARPIVLGAASRR